MTGFQQFRYLQCEMHVTHTVYTAYRPRPCTYYIHKVSCTQHWICTRKPIMFKEKKKNHVSEVIFIFFFTALARVGSPAPKLRRLGARGQGARRDQVQSKAGSGSTDNERRKWPAMERHIPGILYGNNKTLKRNFCFMTVAPGLLHKWGQHSDYRS